jgi:hypothetical protein
MAFGGDIQFESSIVKIEGSTLHHNQAIGGSNNWAFSNLVKVGGADGGDIFASGLFAGGGLELTSGTKIHHSSAIGGSNNLAANLGSDPVRSVNDAQGGALYAQVTTVTITDSTLEYNQARGGTKAIVGNALSNGGNAQGGGLYLIYSTTMISNSTISNNQAIGGDATSARGNGGNGQGGGIFNDANSTLTLAGTSVTENSAIGGHGSGGGTDGEGKGGGVYNLGTFNYDLTDTIKMNHASTSNDDIFT